MPIDRVHSSSAVASISQEQESLARAPLKRKNPFESDELYSMKDAGQMTQHHIMRRLIDHCTRLTPTICSLQQLERKMAAHELSRFRELTDNKVWLNNLQGFFDMGGGVIGGTLAGFGYDSASKAASALSHSAVAFTESSKIRANDDSQTILNVSLSATKDTERHLGDHSTRYNDLVTKMLTLNAEASRLRA
jgi:hypothetical protein